LVDSEAGDSVYVVYCGNPRMGRCPGSLYLAGSMSVSVIGIRVQDHQEDVAVVSISQRAMISERGGDIVAST
jgi:hypothetical protein